MWRRLIYHPDINYALRQTLVLCLPVADGLIIGQLHLGLLFSLVPACCNIAGLDTPHKRFFKRLVIGASLFAGCSLIMQLLLAQTIPLPLILTGPKESADYFRVLDEFIVHTLGEAARRHYRIIIDDAAEVARQMKKAMPLVKENRRDTGDAYSFNWAIRISPDLQVPFEPTHENMANLKLYPDQPVEVLAADLRRAFSGIVAGNVKEVGIRAIEEFGPYKIHGDREMMRRMDDLLQGFVAQHRMKLPGTAYIPCYEICA